MNLFSAHNTDKVLSLTLTLLAVQSSQLSARLQAVLPTRFVFSEHYEAYSG